MTPNNVYNLIINFFFSFILQNLFFCEVVLLNTHFFLFLFTLMDEFLSEFQFRGERKLFNFIKCHRMIALCEIKAQTVLILIDNIILSWAFFIKSKWCVNLHNSYSNNGISMQDHHFRTETYKHYFNNIFSLFGKHDMYLLILDHRNHYIPYSYTT